MIVTFVCPSTPEPVGGVTVLFELANGLARRGHRVQLLHGPVFGERVRSLDELGWFAFEPAVEHHFLAGDGPDVPTADVIFGTGARPELGLPVLLIQGIDMFDAPVEREAFRTPALKIAVASWLAEAVGRFGVPADQVHVVPTGIDHERFRPPSAPGERPVDVALLHHPHPAKGWDVGLEVLHEVRRRRPGVRALTFGTWGRPADLPPWVDHVDAPTPDELARDVYGAARVFLQTSRHEGFGLTAVEAMACGCALVTTDNGGSQDYALPGRTALVRPPGDAAGLAADVTALLADPDRLAGLARAGRELVAGFTWDRAVERVEDLLHRYVADPDAFRRPSGADPSRPPAADPRPAR